MLTGAEPRGTWRRGALALPYADQVPLLAPFLDPDGAARARTGHPRALRGRRASPPPRGLPGRARSARGRLELPLRERHRLEGSAAGSIVHAAVLRAELAGVCEELAGACGEPPLVIKGAAVAERFYSDRRLRPYFDLDLLVPRERLDAAAAALEARGYERAGGVPPRLRRALGHDVSLRRRRRGAGRMSSCTGASATTRWERRSLTRAWRPQPTVDIDGAAIARPAPPAHLLVLAVHLLSDREKRLCWVNDVALVAGALDDDAWEEAFGLADDLDLAWPLHRALDYAQAHLAFERPRPRPTGPPPAWGPLRAVEDLNVRASPHVGRLATLGWRERLSFLGTVLVPTRAGLDGTVGRTGEEAGTLRLAGRHVRQALAGLVPRREPGARRARRRRR